MNATSKTMYETLPVVSELNKVSGFDPRKFIRKTVSEATKQEVLYLDLKFKKLWFRLAHPTGRIKVTALKITEQIAIIEAKIFFNKSDTEAVSSFIAQRNAKGKPGSLYIESAQHAAVSQALNDAGFGLQFCDVSQGADPEMLDEGVPLSSATTDTLPLAVTDEITPVAEHTGEVSPADEVPPAEEIAPVEETPPAEELPPVENTPPVEQSYAPDTEAAPVMQEDIPAQPEDIPARPEGIPSQTNFPAQAEAFELVTSTEQPSIQAVDEEPEEEQTPDTAPQAPRYTADMPVEEILVLMTPDEAEEVVVDIGTCKGWTLAEVAERRPASLKWYLNGYSGDNNILKAGAKLLLETGLERKAG